MNREFQSVWVGNFIVGRLVLLISLLKSMKKFKIYFAVSILTVIFACSNREAIRQVVDIEQLIRERDSLQKRLQFVEKENKLLKTDINY